MGAVSFTEEDIERLAYERFHHPHPRVRRKLEGVLLKAKGFLVRDICDVVGCCPNTLRNWLRDFEAGGVEGLTRWDSGGKTCEFDAHTDAICDHLNEHPPHTIAEARDTIRAAHRRTSRRHPSGRVPQTGRVQAAQDRLAPREGGPGGAGRFQKKELLPRLKQADAGKRHVYFVDASHFVYGAFLGYLWCAVRRFVPTGSGRQRLNVLGAVAYGTGRMVTVINRGSIGAEQVCELLRAVKRRGRKPTTLVLDNASYHRAKGVKALAAQLGIELLFLPPYSPNLNLIERVWKLVKKLALNARTLSDFDAFAESVTTTVNELETKHQEQLLSLLTPNFQDFTVAQLSTV
jgi:transposase